MKGCSIIMVMLHAEKLILLFMHSQKRPEGHGHNYRTQSVLVFIWGLFLISRKAKLY